MAWSPLGAELLVVASLSISNSALANSCFSININNKMHYPFICNGLTLRSSNFPPFQSLLPPLHINIQAKPLIPADVLPFISFWSLKENKIAEKQIFLLFPHILMCYRGQPLVSGKKKNDVNLVCAQFE